MTGKHKIVLIDWVDTGIVHGWLCDKDIGNSLAHCQTVGFWVKEDEGGITVAYARSDQGLIMEKKSIPKGSIVKIKELRIK